MKEYLFRGKAIFTDEWREGSLVIEKSGYHIRSFDGLQYIPVKEETVGLFTGLLDKNKKKIFEGDIVKYKIADFAYPTFWEAKIPDIYIAFRKRTAEESLEVIGNIYDNPELVK